MESGRSLPLVPQSAPATRGVAPRRSLRPRPQAARPPPAASTPAAWWVHGDVGGRARGGITGAAKSLALRISQLALGKIRQFEIVKEQVDKFFAGQNEPERIFTVAFARRGSSSAAFPRTGKDVAFGEFLVSGKHHVADAAFAVKARFIHPVKGDTDLAALQDIPDVTVLRRFLDCTLNQRLGATQKTLAVLQAFAARIQPPVYDVHSHSCIPPQPACFTRIYHSTSRR